MPFYVVAVAISIFAFSYLPGRIIVSRLKLANPISITACSFGFSWYMLFIVGTLVYLSIVPPAAYGLLLLISIVAYLYLIRAREIHPREIQVLCFFFISFAVFLLYQALIPYYSGALWYYDWFEHYQRSLFFLDHYPDDFIFLMYRITARPPLFNIVSSVFLSVFGKDFWVYQIGSTLLNAAILLPGFMLIDQNIRGGKRRAFLLFISLAVVSPFLFQQVTYTWTKASSAYFILTGCIIYLTTFQEKKLSSFLLAAFFLGAGHITHYSAAPFALIIFLHMFFLAKRAFFLSVLMFLLTISPWYAVSSAKFGPYQTFLGNTSFEWQRSLTMAQQVRKNMYNTVFTLVPGGSKRHREYMGMTNHPLVLFTDFLTEMYTNNIPGSLTLTFFILLAVWGLRNRNIRTFQSRHLFLLIFLFIGTIVSILTVPMEVGGVAEIVLVPVSALLFFTAVLCFIRISEKYRLLRTLLGVTLAVEAALGIGLRLYVARRILNPRLSPTLYTENSTLITVPQHRDNYTWKTNYQLVFLEDIFSDYGHGIEALTFAAACTCWAMILRA